MDTKIKIERTGLQMLTCCDSQKKEKTLVIDVGPAHLKIDKDLLDLDKPLSSQDLVRLNPFGSAIRSSPMWILTPKSRQ